MFQDVFSLLRGFLKQNRVPVNVSALPNNLSLCRQQRMNFTGARVWEETGGACVCVCAGAAA